jgi:mannose-1-phosphate guanylyltransferase/mannose-6-phosphate isomerase
LSTHLKPKQFHALHGQQTMFAQTLERIAPGQTVPFGAPVILCGDTHAGSVREELMASGIKDATLILEPAARNTAPAVAVAALLQAETDPDGLMLVLSADAVITKPERLHQACLDAQAAALDGWVVTFGITPLSPETAYGYIKTGAQLSKGVFVVDAFREKPDRATAQAYLAAGSYAWNAGIFFFTARAFLRELALHAPLVLEAARLTLGASRKDKGEIYLDEDSFTKAPSISVDYAVMEPTKRAAVVPVDMGWSDVGSFSTLWDLAQKDEATNVCVGKTALFDSSGCLVRSETIPVAVIGAQDLVIIATDEGILICTKDRAQDVGLAAHAFKAEG